MFFDQLDSSQVARVEAIIQCVVAAFEEDHTEELTVNLITPMHYDTPIKETYLREDCYWNPFYHFE